MGIEGGGIDPRLPGPLVTERTPSGDGTPDLEKEPECRVVCALLRPLFVGTSALLFAEFCLPKSLGFFSCTVTRTTQPLIPAASPCLPLDLSLFYSYCQPLHLSLFIVSVSLPMEGDMRKLLWTRLNGQHLHYNSFHFQGTPPAENFTKMAPLEVMTLRAMAGAFPSSSCWLVRTNEGWGRVDPPSADPISGKIAIPFQLLLCHSRAQAAARRVNPN